MPEEPSEESVAAHAAIAQVASVVGLQAGLMGGIMGCCWALLIIMIGFLVGLFFFLHDDPKDGDKGHTRDPKTHESR